MDPADSYLPRVIGIFLAVLDPSQSGGSKVLYQVPSNLITTSASSATVPSSSSAAAAHPLSQSLASLSVTSSSSGVGDHDPQQPSLNGSTSYSSTRPRSPHAPRSRSPLREQPLLSPREEDGAPQAAANGPYGVDPLLSTPETPSPPTPVPNSPLLSFEQIASFCVPQTPLCNRLCTITSGAYKIQGYPMLHEDKDARKGYERHEFRWNICWVFDRWRYQGQEFNQVVRKVARVLASCEEDSCFISSPATGPKVFEILQQLMEDLNTYAEASIPIDQSSSIEIKLFPNLPNPTKVENWHVPIPLIDLKPQLNWDLSMSKVVRFIDGTSHVKHIAERADVAVDFARTCVEHLLYYEAVMLIDIFEWSNMYTIKPSFQTLSIADHVMDECAQYCRRDAYGEAIEWATLCSLYTRFRPGLTIDEWEEEHHVDALGIDVRRFVTFGVIKGFLRRVHRWPVFQPNEQVSPDEGGDETPHPFGSPRLSGGESGFSLHSLGLAGLNYPTTDESAISLADDLHQHHRRSYDLSPKTSTSAVPRPRHRTLSRAFDQAHDRRSMPPIPASQSPTTVLTTPGGAGSGRSHSPSSQSLSLDHVRPGAVHHSRSATSRRRRGDKADVDPTAPWGDLGYPPGLSTAMLDGDRHTDELGCEFDLPWAGEHGVREVLKTFARKSGGEVLYVLR